MLLEGRYCSDPCSVRHKKNQAEYYQKNKETRLKYGRQWRKDHPDRCRELCESWRNKNRQKVRDGVNRHQKKLRAEIIEAYGSKCACCGEKTPQFLTVDHIDGGGKQERQKMSSNKFLVSIRNRGFPKDLYRLLCWNCNSGRAINGGVCPHKERQSWT